ncbi:MAG: insulinase family protein [Bacteroidales bacterium]|nr:insulinase family protein [Bacteroidales bacterium]
MKRVFAFIAAVMFAAMAFAQQMPPIPIDPAVRIGKLDNGLTYYIRHNEEPKGQANFYIAQKVGSILEEEEQRGLAHFLEHMCFNGTEHFPGNGVIKYCESIGVKFGADLNAYTSIDETVYNIDNVPVAKVPSSIDSCLWILHDWADGLLLTDKDIDSERGVIHEEWRSRSGAQNRMLEKILPEVYPGNRYGERLPIGLMSVVDFFPYQRLRDYYEKWYRPDQQGIVVVGDIDVDAVEAKIKDIFGTIATPVNPAERFYVQVEDNTEPIVSIAKDKEQPYAMSFIFCKHDAYPVEMKGDLSYLIYSTALYAIQSMLSERIDEIMQSPNPPFIQAQISDDDYLIAKTKKAFQGMAVSSEADILTPMKTVYREMLRAVRGGFTASEYERFKTNFLSELETRYNQRSKVKSAAYCSEYVRHFIDNEPIPGIENEYAMAQQLLPSIPVTVVNQLAATLMAPGMNNVVVMMMLPDKEGVTYPSGEEIVEALKAVAAEDIKPYEDAVSDEPLMSELPVPGRVVKTGETKFGYKMYKLSNGATVYMKHTDFNPDEILMAAYSQGGTSLYGDADNNNLKALPEVIGVGGLGSFSATDLPKVLAGKNVSVNRTVGSFSEGVSAKTTPKDLETMLQLNYLGFTSMRYDEKAFESWRSRNTAALANREANPMSAIQDTLVATIYTNSYRVSPLKTTDLAGLDYGRIMEIARERFADASDFVFVFTGNIDEDALPLIERYIGSLPATGKKEKADLKAYGFAKGKVSKMFDRQMETPMVTNFFLDNAKTKASLKNNVAFDIALSALSNVLLEEIREKEGGTYGIGAYGGMDFYPKKEMYMQIAYQTDPDKYEHLNGKVAEIVKEFAKSGPSEEAISKAKEYMVKKYHENLHENGYFSSAVREYLNSGVDVVTGYEEVVKSVTAKDIRKVFNQLLKAGNHAEVIMKGVK